MSRTNDLHREHRATYLERLALQWRGLDYTDASARTAIELRRIEIELTDAMEQEK